MTNSDQSASECVIHRAPGEYGAPVICRHGTVGCTKRHDHEKGDPMMINTSADVAAPHAHVLRKRQWPFVVVRRYKANGACDWFTYHLTRWGARRAVDIYQQTGEIKGIRP
jgi:hypothetical protein